MRTRQYARKPAFNTSARSAGSLLQTRPFQAEIAHPLTLQHPQKAEASTGKFDLTKTQYLSNPQAIAAASQPLQAKLTIGQPNDKYEQEADRVAHHVVQQIQTSTTEDAASPASEQREKTLQMKSLLQKREALEGSQASSNLEANINQARISGKPLDTHLQQQMGQAMEADFSNVKVHTGNQADQLNRSVQAKAFTTGKDIFFRQGEYNPNSQAGQKLIAHELTHVVQQNASIQRQKNTYSDQPKTTVSADITQVADSNLPIQRLMSSKEFQKSTKGTLFHPRKRIAAIDDPLKKIDQSGMDHILLTELLTVIDGWLAVADDESSRKPIVLQLRDQVMDEMTQIGTSLNQDFDPENPPPTRQRRNAFSAQVTGVGKKYGSNFSDFDSKQFRVSGRAPNRRIEEVKRAEMEDGTVVYYATGLVTNFKGKIPMIAPYPDPVPLGDWYPKVTHINGMAVAPKSGLLSAAALQESVNKSLDGEDDVAFGQDAVDVLYTYSTQRGGVVIDLVDCIKGKVQIKDEATKKQEEIMLDAVHRQERVTVSAHSRGTIKTDNAVRNVHEILTQEYLPSIRQEKHDEVMAYWEINDPGIGIPADVLAELSFSGFAAERAKQQMNAYIHLVYAGNAVQHPSALVDINMFVGGVDLVSMFVGTYSEIGRKLDSAVGMGGSKKSNLKSVGKGKGHGFVGNYVPSVGKEIAGDIKKR